jgi:hypothetical protein
MRPLSNLQKEVISLARNRLEKYPWFMGVCLDNLPSDSEIEVIGLDEAVNQVVDTTFLWDA